MTKLQLDNIYGKVAAAILFVATLIANYLVSAFAINGTTTGQVSDAYPNLFAPIGFTFAIWGVIYVLLALYTVRQFGVLGTQSADARTALQRVTPLFILTSLINIVWVFAWQYYFIGLALLLIVALLITLASINIKLKTLNLAGRDNWTIKLPFAVYFGWVTVATIANTVIWLVSINWDGWGVDPQLWTVAVMVVGAVIGITAAWRLRSAAYILVFAWAYFGIVAKHVSPDYFNGNYPAIIGTGAVLIAAFLASAAWIAKKRDGLAAKR